jgi:predicted lipid-binding transport protein (Tim44 family)
MYWNEIKRISMAGGFITGLFTLILKLFLGHSLLVASYTAIIIMMSSSIILLLALRLIGKVLSSFLIQKKLEAESQQAPEEDNISKTKAKVEELKQKRMQAKEQSIKDFEEKVNASSNATTQPTQNEETSTNNSEKDVA